MLTSTLTAMSNLFPAIADALIKTTVLLIIVGMMAWLLRRASASLRHLLWTMAIVGLVAIPLFTVFTPVRLRVLPASLPASLLDRAPVPASSSVERVGQEGSPVLSETPVALSEALRPGQSEGKNPHVSGVSQADASTAPRLWTVLAVVWLAGVMAVLGRFALARLSQK